MRVFAVTGLVLLAIFSAPGALAQQAADTIVTHGKILTVDAAFRTVEALAISNGRIVATGTSADIARYAGKNTRVIDVAGATVIPGLIDNHFHFTRGADTWHQQARFEGVESRREALRILGAKAASLKPGEWIMVQGGWTPRQFADAPGGFTLEELDGVAPNNPTFVQEGYSVVYANGLALKAVGLNPADGARRNAQGLVSFQPPMALYDAMPKTSAAQREQNLTDFMRELNSTGLTGVYSLGQSEFLAARAAKGPLPLRLWQTLNFNAADPTSASKAAELISRSRPNQFDGQHGIFGLGEVLYGPFFDLAPRKEPWPAAIMSEYGKLATAAARAGWHVHQHVINNNAVTDLLDTLEQVNKTQPLTGLRWTLGHVYDISAVNIARAKAMGITLGVHGAAMQAGAHMPLRRIADSGIVYGLGTDATIVSHYSPFVTLGWVVSGLDVGGNKVLDETLTREEALIAHTRSNAYLFSQEKALGSLEVGKQADLVVLDRDYMTVPAADIKRITPTMTMVGGRVVFERESGTLSEALRAHVKDDRFQIVTSIRGLPLGVRDALQVLFGTSTLDIAERGAEFGSSTLSKRRLVAAGCSMAYCLVYYERDGTPHTWHVALFHWTPAATRFEWGGTAPSGLKTIDAVRNAVQSGAIKSPNNVW
jgi:predicted amidohydrolase YtcJ